MKVSWAPVIELRLNSLDTSHTYKPHTYIYLSIFILITHSVKDPHQDAK